MEKSRVRPATAALSAAAAAASVLAALALKSVSYLLFHTVAELFSIVIAEAVFLIALASRRLAPKTFYGLLGVSLGTVGLIDIVHTLTYKGMGLLPLDGANRATQLWVAGRLILAFSILIALSLAGQARTFRFPRTLLCYAVVGTATVAAVFTGLFPRCYVEGTGLTAFKVGSEYAIMAVFATTIALLVAKRRLFRREELLPLVLGLACLIAAEFLFTLYIGVYDLSNFLGHLGKIAGYYFLGQALVSTSLMEPLATLFRDADRRIAELTDLNARIAAMQSDLVRTEKLAFLGKLSAAVAHRINTPLGAVASLARGNRDIAGACLSAVAELPGQAAGKPGSGTGSEAGADRLALLSQELRQLDANEALVLKAVAKAERAIFALRGYTDAATSDLVRACDLAVLADAVLEAHGGSMEGSVRLERDYRAAPPVEGVPELLSLVIENLVLNALQAMDWRGRLRVAVFPAEDSVLLSVEDDGPGIPAGLQGRVFEPFFTTKPHAEGLGLGLDLSRRIVEEAGGSIDFESGPGRTQFRVRLPVQNERSRT